MLALISSAQRQVLRFSGLISGLSGAPALRTSASSQQARGDMAQSLPTKAPGTSRPPRQPRGDFILLFFCLFLNCTSKLYPTCGGSPRGGRAGPHLGAEPVPPPAQPRQATRLCFKPVVEGRSTYRGRGEAWTVEGTGSVPPARAAAPRAAGLASPSLPKLQRHPRYGSPARMTAN